MFAGCCVLGASEAVSSGGRGGLCQHYFPTAEMVWRRCDDDDGRGDRGGGGGGGDGGGWGRAR